MFVLLVSRCVFFFKEMESLDIIWDAEKTLNSFCAWQSYYRSKTRNPAMVDAAILITK